MQAIITGRHVEMTDEVRNHVNEKVQKLTRFYDRIHEIEAVFDHESDQFTCELIVRVDHKNTFVAKELGPDTFALIDLCVEKVERQIKKHKEKNRSKKGGVAADGTTH